jgi:hypothetical protein
MQRESQFGSVIYSNKNLGIEEGEYPRNSHFYEEGKEKPVERKGKKGLQVGYRDPLTVGSGKPVTLEDVYIIFDGDTSITGAAKSTVVYTKEKHE